METGRNRYAWELIEDLGLSRPFFRVLSFCLILIIVPDRKLRLLTIDYGSCMQLRDFTSAIIYLDRLGYDHREVDFVDVDSREEEEIYNYLIQAREEANFEQFVGEFWRIVELQE